MEALLDAVTPAAAEPRVRRPRPPPITVTPAAAERIADLIAKAPEAAAGVRLTTPKRGCSGLAYSLAYVTAPAPGDEPVATPGGTLFIDAGALMYLIGSDMDWVEDDFAAGFVFTNPNAKGQCGCGESFTV